MINKLLLLFFAFSFQFLEGQEVHYVVAAEETNRYYDHYEHTNDFGGSNISIDERLTIEYKLTTRLVSPGGARADESTRYLKIYWNFDRAIWHGFPHQSELMLHYYHDFSIEPNDFLYLVDENYMFHSRGGEIINRLNKLVFIELDEVQSD